MSIWSEIAESITTRVKSPILGSVFIAFLAVNWKEIVYLIFETQVSITDRIKYFEDSTTWVNLYVYPSLVGLALAIVGPYISWAGSMAIQKAVAGRKLIGVDTAAKIQRAKADNARISAEIERIEETRQEQKAFSSGDKIINYEKQRAMLAEIKDPDRRVEAMNKLRQEYFGEAIFSKFPSLINLKSIVYEIDDDIGFLRSVDFGPEGLAETDFAYRLASLHDNFMIDHNGYDTEGFAQIRQYLLTNELLTPELKSQIEKSLSQNTP